MSQSSDSRLGSLAHWFTFRESRLTAQFFGLPAYFLGLLDLSLGSLARKSWLTGLRVSDSVTASRDGFVAHWIRVETHVFRLTLNYLLIGLQNRSSAHRRQYQIKKWWHGNQWVRLLDQWVAQPPLTGQLRGSHPPHTPSFNLPEVRTVRQGAVIPLVSDSWLTCHSPIIQHSPSCRPRAATS